MTHEQALTSIDRHFAGTLRIGAEAEMRAHLPACAACRARYERHLLYARLSRDARPAKQRLARGLGFRMPHEHPKWPGLLAVAAAAAMLALVIGLRGAHRAGQASDDLGVRGGPGAPAVVLWVYRLAPGGAPALADGRLARTDELAFAYANPVGRKYLWIFGVDEHRHVFWYYPAWTSGAPAPAPFPARPGAGPHELPEAVRHALDGGRLDIYAMVSDEPLAVTEIERRVTAAGAPALANAAAVKRSFEVAP